MNMQIFGQRLKELRKSRNVSSEELAKVIGVNKSTINRYENFEFKSVKQSTLDIIADYLDVDVDYLIGKSNDRYTLNSLKNLLKKAQRSVDDILDITVELLKQDGLTFSGKPANDESVKILLNAIEIGFEMAKRNNK